MKLSCALLPSLTISILATVSGCAVNNTAYMEETFGAVQGELPSFSDPKLVQLAADFETGRNYARTKGKLQYDPARYPVCDISEAAFKKLTAFQEGSDFVAMQKQAQAAPQKSSGSLAAQASAANSTAGTADVKEHVIKNTLLAYELRTSPEECANIINGTATIDQDRIIYSKIQNSSHLVMDLLGKTIVKDSGTLTETTTHTVSTSVPGQLRGDELITETLSSVHITDGAGLLTRTMVGDMGSYSRSYIKLGGEGSLTFMENNQSKGIYTTMHSYNLEGNRHKSVTYHGKEMVSVYRMQDNKRHGLQENRQFQATLGNITECYEMGEKLERPDCLTF